MKHWILYCQTLLALTIFMSLPVSAYSLSPSIVELKSIGNESSAFLRLENKGIKPAAVEFTINKHSKDLDGKAIQGEDAGDDFIIYPQQVVMMPGDEVTVQVLWVGEPALDTEQSFTMFTREIAIPHKTPVLPDSNDKVVFDITILMNYESRIYVTPLGAKSKTIVASVKQDSSSAEPELIEVILANQGTTHQSMSKMSLAFVPLNSAGIQLKQQAITLDTEKIPAMRGHLLAGGQRRLLIPRPAELPLGKFDVILSE